MTPKGADFSVLLKQALDWLANVRFSQSFDGQQVTCIGQEPQATF